MARVIVLGGTGFLGKHVMRLASEAGHHVVSMSRRSGVDLRDAAGLAAALSEARPDAVINCAAHVGSVHYVSRHAAEVLDDNIQMALNLYAAVRQACPKTTVINPLSNCSYPGDAVVQSEGEWFDGPVHESVASYGNGRRVLYMVSDCYHKQYGTKTINWIVANAYGPGDYLDPDKVHALNGIILRMIQSQRAGQKTFEIWGTGKPIREWCYIEDAARMLVGSIGGDPQVSPINLGQKRGYSIEEIAHTAAAELKYEPEFVFNTKFADGAPTKVLDDTCFRSSFPDFQFTSLSTGVHRTVEFYRSVLTANT